MTWGVTAIVTAAVATTASVVQNKKSAKAQRKANEVSRKVESRQLQRDRMQALREAQILRAQGQQMAVNTGTVDSSGYLGQQAGVLASTAGNIAFSQQVDTGATVIGQYTQQAADSQNRAGNWAALASLSLQAASMTGTSSKTNTPVGPVQ